MRRMIVAFVNFNCCKTVDEFSGDKLMTIQEGEALLSFIERYMGPRYAEDVETGEVDEFGDNVIKTIYIDEWEKDD